MADPTPPVYLEGEGVITSDGMFVGDLQLRILVGIVADLCQVIDQLPAETRVVLEALLTVLQAEGHDDEGETPDDPPI